jgi:hypothetical protein
MSAHLTPERLAEHAEGLLAAGEAAAVAAHLAECPSCRSVQADLAALRAVLAADGPGPMPADVAVRIDAALAEARAAARAFQPPVPADSSAVRDAAGNVAGRPATDNGQRTSPADLLARRRQRYRWYTRIAAAAAGLVVVVGGSVLGVQLAHDDGVTGLAGGGAESAGRAEDSGQPPAPTAAREAAPPYAAAPPRGYTREGFAGQVAALLSRMESEASGMRSPRDAATGSTAAAVTACATRFAAQQSRETGAPAAAPLAVDVAVWEGSPALVVLLPEPGRPDAVHAYVIPRECPGARTSAVPVLFQAVVPRS